MIVEHPPSRRRMARRRARRVGWVAVVGQILFVAALQPVLRHLGARDDVPRSWAQPPWTRRIGAPVHRVRSVNDEETVALLASLRPTLVVVHGTRIIGTRSAGLGWLPGHQHARGHHASLPGGARRILGAGRAAPGMGRHDGASGGCRNRHGGDPGQATFDVTSKDSIATYPDLHLVHGLPLLGAEVDNVMAGRQPEPQATSIAPGAPASTTTPPSGATSGAVGATASAERTLADRQPPSVLTTSRPWSVHYHRCSRSGRRVPGADFGHRRARGGTG